MRILTIYDLDSRFYFIFRVIKVTQLSLNSRTIVLIINNDNLGAINISKILYNLDSFGLKWNLSGGSLTIFLERQISLVDLFIWKFIGINTTLALARIFTFACRLIWFEFIWILRFIKKTRVRNLFDNLEIWDHQLDLCEFNRLCILAWISLRVKLRLFVNSWCIIHLKLRFYNK